MNCYKVVCSDKCGSKSRRKTISERKLLKKAYSKRAGSISYEAERQNATTKICHQERRDDVGDRSASL